MVYLSKAFDRVDTQLLVTKLKQTSFPPLNCNLVGFAYSNTNVTVKFYEFKFRPWLVRWGVRQGCVLLPLLFSYYINEIMDKISEMNFGCLFASFKFNKPCYDLCGWYIALITPFSYGLQQLIERICCLMTDLGLKINDE